VNQSGVYVNNLSGEMSYQSFKPNPLPPVNGVEISERMLKLVAMANTKLAELNTAGNLIPNADLFISMYVRKEALISSQIEGTQCTLDDILDPDNEISSNLDVSDVINYVNAVSFAINRMTELPLCLRLIRETHAVLLKNVRGEEKNPGEFRRSQNWIGPSGCSIKNARYIPPNVEDMNECMSELEKYINESDEYDALIRAALIHYQFETIHPFLDGNGRIGRLLILLYLMEQKCISKPILYISFFLKKNQLEYYDRISEVRRSGNYEQWIMFFLEAVTSACTDSLETVTALSELHEKNLLVIPHTQRSIDTSRELFDYIEQHPIIDIGKTAKAMNLSFNTISALVTKFEKLGILKKTTNKSRNRVYEYSDYLNILRKDT